MRLVRTPVLEIAALEQGPSDGAPVVLMHGFPSDVHDYEQVVPALAAAGYRVLVPWLRGYGPTRFRNPATPRSGQQAALAADLLGFLDALEISSATLAGYDWGGRACCIVAALWPERVRGLVTIGGYNIQDIARANEPALPTQELRYWYQWYLNTPRGEAGLTANRREIGRLLWRMWSPNWAFDEPTLARTAASWDNPDFVAVSVHSYRHRYGAADGDPALAPIERRLAARPRITVPTVVLEGAADGAMPPTAEDRHAPMFTASYRREVLPRVGHFLPREAPEAVVAAVGSLGAAG
ncbi:Alpha/beta hydrolase [Rhodovastum atsumiense]|uniref:Alpha/beta hydrolase n=1 Tax=Rhodovastum atsumiense TaxID=504468 RepID=A0A5M6IZ34_9PROT|nr:alpha/beta hydrolase [Rhodovastum atsumiense]KAA5613604.1 alpha/beta hydrolase [Rhodovastum atsumiense]CAH2599506.1 Alpha/beta hydrolase [Rhodovastum atsumiense]